MPRPILMGLAVCLLFFFGRANAQICPLNGTSSGKLVCVIPQTFGSNGLGGTGAGTTLTFNGHQGHFENDFLSSFEPINEAVGIQVSQLPIASPSSGITFTYDPTLKTFAPSTEETLGPVIGERAGTIGRNKLYVAFSFQYFNFDTIDGKDLSNLPAVFQHQPVTVGPPFNFPCANQTGMTGQFAGQPCFVRDYIQTFNKVDLSVHQYTIYATYGLTSRLDFSVAIPILGVNIKNTATATIVPNSVAPTSPNFPHGVFHEFNPSNVPSCGSAAPCLKATFVSSGSAAGLGDITLRGKYELYRGEHAGFAAGMDVRLPSGDESNFLGSGATGVKPFGVLSYNARVSPHAVIGYEWNGKSILAGNFVATPTTKGSLPNRFIYALGADVSIAKRLTGAFDFYGQRLFSVPQVFSNLYTDLGKCAGQACSSATFTPGTTHPDLAVHSSVDYSIINAALGLKYRLLENLIVTGNVLVKLNDSGLRSSAVPLVGVSYNF